ncbi:MAG: hypothetical protein IJ390_11770 [Lachnospiraceae bacterium]|nr:hypothetical protein [Lachnospiraceae bacterium]
MKKLCKDFIKCGTIGWCMEILVTALDAFRKREATLTGHTSLFMFPIYGAACLLRPFCILLSGFHWFIRGITYMICIFSGEYASGRFLQKKGCCPWHYHRSPWNINGVIRLDYAPAWFLVGLLFERVIMRDSD